MHKVGLKPCRKIKAISHVFLVLGHSQNMCNMVFGASISQEGQFYWMFSFPFVGLACQGKDIVLRFIIEYSSLRDFGP
jgi:hypothetical protein